MSADVNSPPRPTAAWKYAIPNAITLAGLVIGLASILQSVMGNYENAAWLIVLSVLTDKLDGMTARLLKATSDIGVQLDSFADFVAFGMAPAALVLSLVTGPPGPSSGVALWSSDAAIWLAYAMSTTYVLCACIRLAKFNVLDNRAKAASVAAAAEAAAADGEDEATQGRDKGPGAFIGIPSTFAGAIVAVAVILALKYRIDPLISAMPGVAFGFGLLMVSRLPFPKVGRYPQAWLNWWQIITGTFGYVCGILRILPEYLAVMLLIYLVTGFFWGLMHRADFRQGEGKPA